MQRDSSSPTVRSTLVGIPAIIVSVAFVIVLVENVCVKKKERKSARADRCRMGFRFGTSTRIPNSALVARSTFPFLSF